MRPTTARSAPAPALAAWPSWGPSWPLWVPAPSWFPPAARPRATSRPRPLPPPRRRPRSPSSISSPGPATALPAYPQAEPPPAALEPPPDTLPPGPDSLPALSPAQVADPEAVAARFLGTYATFDAGEDPAGHHARLAEFTTPALADELRRNSSASAALEDLRARNVEFAGQVVEIGVSERSQSAPSSPLSSSTPLPSTESSTPTSASCPTPSPSSPPSGAGS